METQVRDWNAVKTRSLPVLGVMVSMGFFASVSLAQYHAYVTNPGDWGVDAGTVSVIDLATNAVVATVPVGKYPQGVAVNPAGTAAYVANSETNDVTVVDTVTYRTTTIPVGTTPCGVAIHPDGTRIYVANVGDSTNTVSVIDRATNGVIDEVFCGNGSIAVTAHPNGKVVYVTNGADCSLAVLSTETHAVLDTVVLKPANPNELCFPVPTVVHPDGTYVYVANRDGPTLWAVNTATHECIARPFGHNHVGISINPEGTVLYLPDYADEWPDKPPVGTTVEVVDARTLERIATIDGLTGPLDVSVHPDGTRLYVTNWGADTVSVIDASTYSLMATIPVGKHPHGYGEIKIGRAHV